MRVGIQWSPAFSRSRPVITASTPGTSSAWDVSIDAILAWAYGLRTMSIQSMPGRTRSSMYSPLPRMQRGATRHPFDRGDRQAVRLNREHRAGLGATPADEDGARAAVARVAADMGAGQPEDVTQQVDEQEPRLDVRLASFAIDRDGD